MSIYSELLHKYIEEKNIKVAKMIQYCGMDRSSMYKIINGKRKVANLDTARKIAHYMQLSPKECDLYYKAYYKSIVGEEEYEQRQQIEEFICNFNHIYDTREEEILERGEAAIEFVSDSSIHIVKGKAEINYQMRMILEKAVQEENPTIRLLTQCDNHYLRDTLMTLGKNAANIKIQHILCFQKQGEHAKENIELLRNLIPFYGCECQYEPYYYYDEIISHFHNMNLFCNVVICDEGVICYTSDYEYGQILRDEECIEAYKQIFDQYRKQTYPLLTRVESVIQEYLSVGQDVLKGAAQAKAHSLHAEPCVIPFISDEILKKKIRETLPQREQIVELFSRYIKEEREIIDIGNFCCSFTLQGIEKFIRTGKMEEIPEDFYYLLNINECVEIIREMIPYFANGTYRLLKNQLAKINSDLHIFASPSAGHLLFSKNKKELIYVYMNEPGMIQQFLTFMDGLNEELSLYSPEEAVQKVKNLLEKYQN